MSFRIAPGLLGVQKDGRASLLGERRLNLAEQVRKSKEQYGIVRSRGPAEKLWEAEASMLLS